MGMAYVSIDVLIYLKQDRDVGSILKLVRLFSSICMTLNIIIEEVVFLV